MPAPESGFEIVEHTADTAIRGWSPNLDTLFAVMAEGLFKVIGGDATISTHQTRSVHLEAENPSELLHDWLETLNTLHQIHGELYARFELAIEQNRLRGVVHGGPLQQATGELGTEVKAVTWHDLRIQHTPGGLEAYVLLDI
jgi:protein archease